MKKINNRYFYFFWLSLAYGQTALAEFKPANQTQNTVDQPIASAFNDAFYIAGVVLALVFTISMILLLISGIYFITAGGDEAGIETAHSMWRLAAVGLGMALIGYIIINLIKFFI